MFTLSTTFTQADQEQAMRLSRAYYVDLINKFVTPRPYQSPLYCAGGN